MRKNVETSIVEQIVVNDIATKQLVALPTWEPNKSPRHSSNDNATFARVVVRFIIEYFGETDMSFKQRVLEKVFSHPLLNEFMLEYVWDP